MPLQFNGVEIAKRAPDVVLTELTDVVPRQGYDLHWVCCGDETDVVFSPTALASKHGAADFLIVARSSQRAFSDAKWDGHKIWLAVKGEGLRVLQPTGDELLRIGGEQGLPASDRGLLVEPLAANRA